MKAKRLTALLVALPLAFGATQALADRDGGHHGDRKHGGMEKRIWKELNLTDAQKEELKTLRQSQFDNMRDNMSDNMESRMQQHKEMQSLLLKADFDENAVRQLAQQQVEAQVERRVAMAKHRHEMLSVLTDEQKTKFVELTEKHMEKRQQHWQKKIQDDK